MHDLNWAGFQFGHSHSLSKRRLHPPKTNGWHQKIDLWKRRFLLETIILGVYVSFQGCRFRCDRIFINKQLIVWLLRSLNPYYNLKKTGVHFFMAEHSTQNKRIKMLDQKGVGMVGHELRGISRGRTANYIPIYFLYLDLLRMIFFYFLP